MESSVVLKYKVFGREKRYKELRVRLPAVKIFEIDMESIDLSPLSRLKHLASIFISSPHLTSLDLRPLSKLKHLVLLTIQCRALNRLNLSPLSKCESLKSLILRNNRLTKLNLSPLEKCRNLGRLDLSNNFLTKLDLRPLRKCPAFHELILTGNLVRRLDLSPLESIRILDLLRNELNILDVTPLFSTRLEKLSVDRVRVELIASQRFRDTDPPIGLKPYMSLINWVEEGMTVGEIEATLEKRELPAIEEQLEEPIIIISRRASTDKFRCIKCGELITSKTPKCPHCSKTQIRCMICLQFIGQEELYYECIHCGQLAHQVHLQMWLKEKQFCPYCKQKLTLEDLR